MPRRIEDEIRKNRETGVKLEGQTYTSPSSRGETLTIPGGEIEITVSTTIETKSLGGGLVVNHPAAENGVNQGVLGDQRTDWEEVQTLDSGDGVFTAAGREALTEALDGTGTALEVLAVGAGDASPSTADTSLEEEIDAVDAEIETPDDQTLRATASWEWPDLTSAESIGEIGAEAIDDEDDEDDPEETLLARVVPETIDLDDLAALRVVLDIEFTHSSSSAAITDWESISHALDGGTSVQIDELALGTDGTDPDESDIELGDEVVTKTASIATGENAVTLLAVFLTDEPDENTYDIEEAGAIRDDGTLVWRSVFAETTKDDERPLRARATLRLRS